MKRPERFSLSETKRNSRFDISRHLALYKLILPQLSGRILDAGSGDGYGVNLMRMNGLDAWGIDCDRKTVEESTRRYGSHFKVSDVTQISFENAVFDTITCIEVIEHVSLSDGAKALKEMHRLLKPDGALLLSTPNVTSDPGSGTNDNHLHEYAPDELTALLWESGFRGIEFLGVVCSNPAAHKIAKSSVMKNWLKLKYMVGLNRPLAGLGYMLEKVLTGHTTRNILNEDCWSLVPDDKDSATMLVIARKEEIWSA